MIIFIYREKGREGGREGEKHQCERETLYTSQSGAQPATQACALTRNGTGDLSFCGTMSNQLSHTGQGSLLLFFSELYGYSGFFGSI